MADLRSALTASRNETARTIRARDALQRDAAASAEAFAAREERLEEAVEGLRRVAEDAEERADVNANAASELEALRARFHATDVRLQSVQARCEDLVRGTA